MKAAILTLFACALTFVLSAALPVSPTQQRLQSAYVVLSAACIAVAGLLALVTPWDGR
jgi:hypothetical protein